MPSPSGRVIVVGGGLAGMAAAARLAKSGHPVQLFERRGALGGRWRATESPGLGRVDAAPSVLGFPAPWRDLFRKSGRPLEAELARGGLELAPAAPSRHRFADGVELALPTERGPQHRALAAAFGGPAADRWRDLLDALDQVWQALRPLGLEQELPPRFRLDRPLRRRLDAGSSVADLARRLAEPHLEALVRSVAWRHGSAPEQTPAWVAVDLAVSRTFGHWQIQPQVAGTRPGDAGRSSVLTETLAARLALRRVEVHLDTEVEALEVASGRVTGVRTAAGSTGADAVVVTTDPWQLVDRLLPPRTGRPLRRDVHRLLPAAAPAVTHVRLDGPCAEVGETVELSGGGVPVISYRRPAADGGTLLSRHDAGRSAPAPGFGVAWHGIAGWRRRPPVSPDVPGLHLAGPAAPAGNGPSQVVLSAALAAYACHGSGG